MSLTAKDIGNFALRVAEGYTLGVIGANLGAAYAASPYTSSFERGLLTPGVMTASAGFNGAVMGYYQVYSFVPRKEESFWSTVGTMATGVTAFVADSTWVIVGTSLGNLVTIDNRVFGASGLGLTAATFSHNLSTRQNSQVFSGGFRFKGAFATTLGNVDSNGGADGLLQ